MTSRSAPFLLGLLCLAASSAAAAQSSAPPGIVADMKQRMEAERIEAAAVPDSPGSGPFPAVMEVDPGLANHVVYRPANLKALGRKKLGVVLWGNGGCTDDGASAREHLAEIASHGYLVVAPGRILNGPSMRPGAPLPSFMSTTGADMIAGLDWALAENRRRGSRYFGRIDTRAVALSGHSCGGILSIQMSGDPRVRAVIIHNSGVFGNTPQRPTLVTDKAWVRRLHTPVLYIIGNETDVGRAVALDDYARIDHVPVFLGALDVGHGGTFSQPHGGRGLARMAAAWR
jgi:dienelactone hydrolase